MRRSIFSTLASSLIVCRAMACTSTSDSPAANDAATANDTAAANKRNTRYCEILVGKLSSDNIQVDVYSTEGLNDCPDAAWKALDVAALKTELGADIVALNGPRYWMLDSLAGSSLQDAAVKTFGGIDMRKAGLLDVSMAAMATMSQPYTHRMIKRKSAFHWLAGQPVFELRDPNGHAYVMQSYSAQKQVLTLADLPGLATKLTALPTGWTYAPRTLQKDLDLLATAGDATVVQDELGNTYSME